MHTNSFPTASSATVVDWDGPRRQTCPECGRGPRHKTLGVTIDDRGGVAHCHRCGYVSNLFHDDVRVRSGRPMPRQTVGARHDVLADYWRRIWDDARDVSGDGRAYLEARCCVIPPVDGDLRYCPALKHTPTGTSGPALVALVTDITTLQPISLHRTWIRADGTKAHSDLAKMLVRDHRKAGGVIRLWPDDAVTAGLGIAEGIETALSLAHAYQPAWSCIDAGNLEAFPVLPGIESLLIAADHDKRGVEAANACALRWAAAGKEVGIVMPQAYRSDINDLARAAA